jgi:carbamoyltransferase
MLIFGVNETSHDASISILSNNEIIFAAHAERYSKIKNSWYNTQNLWDDCFKFGNPDLIAYYEKPQLKRLRLLTKGGVADWKPNFPPNIPIKYFKHHYSHASAGYYTSKFNDAVIVVLDSIGEYNTSSIWTGEGSKIKQVYKKNYPFSFGLFYSAFTQLVGLKPNEEEYIFMGMAAYGDWTRYYNKVKEYFPDINTQKYNFHRGVIDWGEHVGHREQFDIAAAVQKVYEDRLVNFMAMAQKLTGKRNLVFMGGCALNCAANTMLWRMFDDVWIMPNPGDSGSSLGAAAAAYRSHINWQHPYLGYDLGGEYPVTQIINSLIRDKIAAVATGKAEYGPRALGNRSILADPRDPNIKDKVNLIKKREMFRPFAPVILEEKASEWFDMNFISPYMQYAVKCKKPDLIPSVVHADGTSRVQTVNKEQHPGLYEVLLKWYELTGVPILLNTSLNIKGQPLLNDNDDILNWEKTYNYKILR